MDRQDIRDAAKGEFALTEGTDDPEFLDASWNRAINRGYRWLCRVTKLIGASAWAITTTSAREYTLTGKSPGIAGIDFVLFKKGGTSGNWGTLQLLQAQQLKNTAANFHETDGSPDYYYLRGSNLLGLYPKPDTTNQGAFMEVWGWAFPAELTADSGAGSTPEIETNLHDLLIPCAMYEMAKQSMNAGRPDAQNLVQRYDAERQQAVREALIFVGQLSQEPQYANWSQEDMW